MHNIILIFLGFIVTLASYSNDLNVSGASEIESYIIWDDSQVVKVNFRDGVSCYSLVEYSEKSWIESTNIFFKDLERYSSLNSQTQYMCIYEPVEIGTTKIEYKLITLKI